MFQEMSFDEWLKIVKIEFVKAGLVLPEDEELLQLAHMECMEEKKSIEVFVQESAV